MHEEEGFNIITAFLRFADLGAVWVMWLMVALGAILIVLTFERLKLYLSTRVDAPAMARDLVKFLDAGDIDGAKKRFDRGIAMEERVISDALAAYEKGPLVVEQIFGSSLVRERQRFDRFLNYFGTLGNNAPFIGLFGTVIGIILSFKELGLNPKGGLEVVGPGIAEALVATAVGLLVAIPAVVLYNTFKGMVKARVRNTDFLGKIVLAHVNQPKDEG